MYSVNNLNNNVISDGGTPYELERLTYGAERGKT